MATNKLELIEVMNANGVQVRTDWNPLDKMYEVSVTVGGVAQNDLWIDTDMRDYADKYAIELFVILCDEFCC